MISQMFFGHRRMEPKALGEADHRQFLRPQGVEQALVNLILAESATGLGIPVVLDDGGHLPVVADDDQRGVRGIAKHSGLYKAEQHQRILVRRMAAQGNGPCLFSTL